MIIYIIHTHYTQFSAKCNYIPSFAYVNLNPISAKTMGKQRAVFIVGTSHRTAWCGVESASYPLSRVWRMCAETSHTPGTETQVEREAGLPATCINTT